MALTSNCHRTKNPVDWNFYNPFKDHPRELTVAEKEAIIASQWINNPTVEVSNGG